LFILQTCLKDVAVDIVFEELTCQQQNKQYLNAIFNAGFFSEHFGENRMIL